MSPWEGAVRCRVQDVQRRGWHGSGSVLVRDFVEMKNVLLRKGKRYTARPRR